MMTTDRLVSAARTATQRSITAKLDAIEALDLALDRLGKEGKTMEHGLGFTLTQLRRTLAS